MVLAKLVMVAQEVIGTEVTQPFFHGIMQRLQYHGLLGIVYKNSSGLQHGNEIGNCFSIIMAWKFVLVAKPRLAYWAAVDLT